MSFCELITDLGQTELAKGCGQLQTLRMSFREPITDLGQTELAKGCGQLQTLRMSFCELITDLGQTELDKGCGQLQTLRTSFCELISRQSWPCGAAWPRKASWGGAARARTPFGRAHLGARRAAWLGNQFRGGADLRAKKDDKQAEMLRACRSL